MQHAKRYSGALKTAIQERLGHESSASPRTQYTKLIAANGSYAPVGMVPRNEEAAERAFAGADNELRYHFNLPDTLKLTDKVEITLDPYNLQDSSETVTDPRYGLEVYFNNVKVLPEVIVRTNQLGAAITTPAFTLASVNAELGLGADNIVSLRGINYGAEGGGNWMGIDHVKLNPEGAGTPLKFTSCSVSNGKLTLTWTGTGNLEWAPSVGGPWARVIPAPTSPHSEDVLPNQAGRFYRLRNP